MGRSWTLVVSVAVTLVSGCIKPSEISCGGLICPPSSVCLANQTCASMTNVDACTGIADGAACTTDEFTGSCVDGACVAAVCGNGIVEGSEQCDGSVGNVDCVTYGFDLGTPTCNARCDLDVIDSCTRFGWERVLAIPVNQAWTDGTRFAISSRDPPGAATVYVAGVAVATTQTGPFVTGNAARVVAWDADAIAEAPVGADFIPVAGPDFGSGQYEQVEAAPDDSLYVLINPGCQIYRRAPSMTSWQEIHPVGGNDCSLVRADAGQIYAAIDFGDGKGEVDSWSGTGEVWSLAFAGDAPIYDVETADDGTQWVAGMAGFGPVSAGMWSPFDAGTIFTVAPIGDVVYAGGYGAELFRYRAGQVELFEGPVSGTMQRVGGQLYEMGNGEYLFSGAEYSDRAAIDQGSTALLALPQGGAVTGSVTTLFITSRISGWLEITADINIVTLSARSATDVYVIDGNVLEHFDGIGFTPVAVPTSTVTGLWQPAAGAVDLYVVGPAGVALAYDGSTWHTITPPPGDASCDLASVTGSAAMVIAVGSCGGTGVVWQLSGSTATELYTGGTALAAATITTDGHVVGAGPAGGVVFDGTAWTAEPRAIGASASSTTSTDVWIAGGPDDIVHWDGNAWSRLAVTGASTPYVAVTPREVYITGASEALLLR